MNKQGRENLRRSRMDLRKEPLRNIDVMRNKPSAVKSMEIWSIESMPCHICVWMLETAHDLSAISSERGADSGINMRSAAYLHGNDLRLDSSEARKGKHAIIYILIISELL